MARSVVAALLLATGVVRAGPANDAVSWALARKGGRAQPCSTPGCRYNPDRPGPEPCDQPDPAPQLGDFATADEHLHWFTWCGRFVRMAYGQESLRLADGTAYGSVGKLVADLERHGHIRTGAPPRGALVFWMPKARPVDGKPPVAHAGIALGDGRVIHTGVSSSRHLATGVRIDAINDVLSSRYVRTWCDPTGPPFRWTTRAKGKRYTVPPAAPASLDTVVDAAVRWAQRHVGEIVQPCRTARCRYNPDAWSPTACGTPDPAADDIDLVTDGHPQWYLNCARFVRMAFGQGPQGNADEIYERAKGDLRTTWPAPRGAVVFWSPVGAGLPHMAIALGDGRVVHTGASRGPVRVDARAGVLPRHDACWCDPTGPGLGWKKRGDAPSFAAPGAARVAAGARILCADERGGLWAWGAGRRTPARMPGRDIGAVAAGKTYALALDRAGVAWQLTDAGPTRVPIDAARAIACGKRHGLLVDAGGGIWTWSERDAPARVDGPTGVVAVAAGSFHSVAIDGAGRVWTWGGNRQGQLGRKGNADVPQPVPQLRRVTAVAAGGNHTAALARSGAVWTWGYNWQGQLGDGGTRNRMEPDVVPGLKGVVAVACGRDHTVALDENGGVFCWGDGRGGELGDGRTESRSAPAPVAGLPKIEAIAAGERCTFAVGEDGSLWAWGSGWSGELGAGDRKRAERPVRVWGF